MFHQALWLVTVIAMGTERPVLAIVEQSHATASKVDNSLFALITRRAEAIERDLRWIARSHSSVVWHNVSPLANTTTVISQNTLVWRTAGGTAYVTEHHLVRTRDGVSLFTVVFRPLESSKKLATVMFRTPYGTDSLKGQGESMVDLGFVAVMQDFRGLHGSSGNYECWFTDSNDAHDTISWIKAQEWSNGVVFADGTSANGLAVYFSSAMAPADIRAAFVIVATAQLHRNVYWEGALRYSLINRWLAGLNEEPSIKRFLDNEAPGPYWNPVTMTNKWQNVLYPAVHLAGWYDIFSQNQIDAFEAYQTKSTVGKGLNFLVVVPGGHCQKGQIDWPNANDGIAVAAALAATMFKLLKDPAANKSQAHNQLQTLQHSLVDVPSMHWYVLGPGLNGTRGNYWTTGSDWPAPTMQMWYFTANNTLQKTLPSEYSSQAFVYDPHNPVPTLGGNNLEIDTCGPFDQQSLEEREDVLAFTSPPFSELVAITGTPIVTLFVSSNATDTDFMVKLTDVFPDGRSMFIQEGALRMRWRNGSVVSTLMQPGHVYSVDVKIWSTSYLFNPGHRVRVTVTSSNYPRFNANPNSGQPLSMLNHSTPVIAKNEVHFGGQYNSRLNLPVVSLADLQQTDMDETRNKIVKAFQN